MSSLAPCIGAPAYRYALNWTPSYRDKAAWRLKKIAAWLYEVTLGYRHRHITLPFNDHQTCLDCGASRLYILNTEMYSTAGTPLPIFKGVWKKAGLTATADLAIAKALISNATARSYHRQSR
jgi:hypothetical protein